jgi:tryptophan halogenase
MQQNSIRNIVIVGGGSAGWMTAAALSKVMGTQNYSITLIESELIGIVGVGEATIPMITLYNNVLGLDEDEFVRETNATFKLGIEFVDWRHLNHSYFHPFGLYGVDMDGIGFGHHWLRWMKGGGNPDIGRFNAETEAARQNKFMRTPEQKPQTLPKINYAFQFDASLYAAYLRRYAEKRGVVRIEGSRQGESERRKRLHRVPGLEGWPARFRRSLRRLLGISRLLIEERCRPVTRLEPLAARQSRRHALRARHRSHPLHLRDGPRSGGNGAFRSSIAPATASLPQRLHQREEAMQKLSSRLDGAAMAEPRILKFVTGMRKKCWIRTAWLDSSGFEPLESTSIHLSQVAIAKLLTVFPKNAFNQALIDKFNREMSYEYSSVKDFLIAHYCVTEREDTEFWRYCKNMDIPDSLKARLELFKTRGEVWRRQQSCSRKLTGLPCCGQGLVPDEYHPCGRHLNYELVRFG